MRKRARVGVRKVGSHYIVRSGSHRYMVGNRKEANRLQRVVNNQRVRRRR